MPYFTSYTPNNPKNTQLVLMFGRICICTFACLQKFVSHPLINTDSVFTIIGVSIDNVGHPPRLNKMLLLFLLIL